MIFHPPGLFRYDAPGTRSNPTRNRVPPPAAYGPQLGARLGLSHMQQNLVGLGGNGIYIPSLFPQSPLIRPPVNFPWLFSTTSRDLRLRSLPR